MEEVVAIGARRMFRAGRSCMHSADNHADKMRISVLAANYHSRLFVAFLQVSRGSAYKCMFQAPHVLCFADAHFPILSSSAHTFSHDADPASSRQHIYDFKLTF